jgi:drug/metabolite transporter (DMT)-like permease
MDWKLASLATLALWGSYTIFGNEATKVHGEKVSMMFEGLAMFGVAILVVMMADGGFRDFGQVTVKSFIFAALMGLMSAGGLYLQLYALRLAPEKVSIIALTTGMWPAVTVALVGILRLGAPLLPRQWAGVILATAGLALANWAK